MEASYLHQQALAQAIKKLYMLGHRSYKADSSGLGEIGSGAGNIALSAFTANQDQNARHELILKQLREKMESDRAQEAKDVDFIKGHSPGSPVKSEDYEVREGNALPKNPGGMDAQGMFEQNLIDANKEKYKDYQSMSDQNSVAESSRIGGKYTVNGLETADKNANLNAQDRLRIKSMLGNQYRLGVGGSVL